MLKAMYKYNINRKSSKMFLSKKNYNPDYYKKHKKELAQKYQENKVEKAKYYQDNKENISTREKQYRLDIKEIRTCICGISYNYGLMRDRKRHYSRQIHQDHIRLIWEQLNNTDHSTL